jgi:hypothetical protein
LVLLRVLVLVDMALPFGGAYTDPRTLPDAPTEAVTGRELRRVREHLPDEFETLFRPPAAAGWPQTHRHRPHT